MISKLANKSKVGATTLLGLEMGSEFAAPLGDEAFRSAKKCTPLRRNAWSMLPPKTCPDKMPFQAKRRADPGRAARARVPSLWWGCHLDLSRTTQPAHERVRDIELESREKTSTDSLLLQVG